MVSRYLTKDIVETHPIFLIVHKNLLQGNDRAIPLRAGLVYFTITPHQLPILSELFYAIGEVRIPECTLSELS